MAAITITNAATSAVFSGLTLKEQRFRSARPLKASGRFRFTASISGTDFAADDSLPIFVFPADLGEVYLTGVAYQDDTDAAAVFNGFSTSTSIAEVTLANATEITATNIATVSAAVSLDAIRWFNVAGETFSLQVAGTTEPDAGIIKIEYEVTRAIDLAALVGTS